MSPKPSLFLSFFFDIIKSFCQTAIFRNVNRYNLTLNLPLTLYLKT